MKRQFLAMVIPVLLVTFGFAQTPDAGSATNPANVTGCLGGTDGNYTVTEDGTHQIIKISTSSVDLKAHVGHEVKLVGNKASAADSSFAVTGLNMISEHCASAAVAPAATVIPPSETVITPDPAASAPAVTASAPAVDAAAPAAQVAPAASAPAAAPAPAATVTTPAVDAAAPAAPVNPVAATASTPAVDTVAPAAPASPSSATVSTNVVEAAPAPRPSAHARKHAAAQAAAATAPDTAVTPSPEPASAPAADAATPATTATAVSPSTEPASAPDAAAPAPAQVHRASSLPLLIAFVVLVIVLGTMAPLIGRWRKRKMLERTGPQNLSFTNDEVREVPSDEVPSGEASRDHDKPAPSKVA